FSFHDALPTALSPLSLHDALPISGARALWARGRRRLAKSGNLRASENEAGLRREHFASRAIRAIRKRAGRNHRSLPSACSWNEKWESLGNSRRDVSAHRAGGRCAEKWEEQVHRARIHGFYKIGRAHV